MATDQSEYVNMQLWNRVHSTNPEYTKKTNNGRYDFTSVDPQYQLRNATAVWGPYGDRWGLRNLEFKPLGDGFLMLEACFFYPNAEGGEVEFEIAVDGKLKAGDDVCKKLITAARSKALSWLGFNADVFMGEFDDLQYVKDATVRHGEKKLQVQSALSGIKRAKTAAALDACAERVHELVAGDTIEPADGETLLSEIAKRRKEVSL